MRKLTISEAITLLRLSDGTLSYTTVEPSDVETVQALATLTELGLIDAYDLEKPITEEGISKINTMLNHGINYDKHFQKASITAKKAAFLALLNSGYEPRGLMKILIKKLSPICLSELKRNLYGSNLPLGANKRPNISSSGSSSRSQFKNR